MHYDIREWWTAGYQSINPHKHYTFWRVYWCKSTTVVLNIFTKFHKTVFHLNVLLTPLLCGSFVGYWIIMQLSDRKKWTQCKEYFFLHTSQSPDPCRGCSSGQQSGRKKKDKQLSWIELGKNTISALETTKLFNIFGECFLSLN